MVFEVLLHLSAHHLIYLSGMLRLYEQIGELVNLEQTVCIRTVRSPKLVVPEYLPVILSPRFYFIIRWIRIAAVIMIWEWSPLLMILFIQRYRLTTNDIGRILMESNVNRA